MGRMGRGGGVRAAPDERAHCRRRPVAVSDGDCQAEADRLHANRGRPARPGAHASVRVDARGLYRRVHEWELMSWMRPDVAAAGTPSAGDVWRWALMADGEAATPPTTWFGEPDEHWAGGERSDDDARVHPVRTADGAGR